MTMTSPTPGTNDQSPADQNLKGVFAASLTPLTDDLRPDIDRLLEHGRHLLSSGCHGLVLLGSAGEANSIHLRDRLALIEQISAELPAKQLLIGTGSCSLSEAVELTQACIAAGVYNMLVLPPFYYTPVSDDGVFRYYSELIERVGDSRLKIYLYNFPKLTGFAIGPVFVERFIKAFGSLAAGYKDSTGDLDGMKAIISVAPDFSVFSGTERHLAAIMRAGGAGSISATINVTAPLARKVYDGWSGKDGDILQAALTDVRMKIEKFPLSPVLKAIMRRRSGIAAWENLLPPYTPIHKDQVETLISELPDWVLNGNHF